MYFSALTHTHIQACNDERDLFTNSLNEDLFNLFLSPCFLKLWDLRPFLCFSFPFFFFTPTFFSKNVNKCDHCILCSLLTIAFHGSPAVCVSICLSFNHIKWHCKWATRLRFTGRLAYLISLLTRRTEGQHMRHLLKEKKRESRENIHTAIRTVLPAHI